jgi:CBS domain-containing protein
MLISEICKREVVTCTRRTSAAQIAQLMRDHHAGDVIVVEPRDREPVPVGIVTDRDLVVHVVAAGVGAYAVTASDLICGELVSAAESETVYDAIWYMRSKGVRRLPVVDANGVLIGLLTMDDLSRLLAEEELSELAQLSPHQIAAFHA